MRDPLASNLPDLLNHIVDCLFPVLQDGVPLVFFGHSLGALLAFEVARRFRAKRMGTLPAALIVSGRTPPHLPLNRPALHRLADDELLRAVAKFEGIPEEIESDREMCKLILPPLRADLKLDETYVYSPEPPLDCPILACCGLDDPEAPASEMREWQSCTRSGFVFKTFEGGHFFMNRGSGLFTVELASFLQRVIYART